VAKFESYGGDVIGHDDSMRDLVAAHALGAVDASSQECSTVREHLRSCEICREEYRIASAAATAVGMSAAQAPPRELRERILLGLPAARDNTVVQMRRGRRWFVAAGTAAAVVLAGAIWWAQAHRISMWVAACMPGATSCHASGVLSMTGTDRMHLDINGLAKLPPGKAYQAWVIVPGAPPKPEPVLATNSQGAGSVEFNFKPPKGTIVAVTVEPAGGSSKPTSKPFVAATVE